MKKLLIFLGALAAYGTDCTISDTVRTPFGGYFAGRIVVALNSPGSAQPLYSGSQTLTGWQTTIEVPASANGVVAFTLVCTDTITPSGTSYSARYQPTSGSGWAETWSPATGTTTIRAMRATTVPTPTTTFQASQIVPGNNGQVLTTTAGASAWGSVPACATCVVTSGSYADPAWITSLAGSKVSGNIAGNAGTATALAANGTNCAAGTFPLGVDASGNSESCTALPTTITGTANQITASASTGAVTLSLPSTINVNTSGNAATATGLASTLTTGRVLYGQGTGVPATDSAFNFTASQTAYPTGLITLGLTTQAFQLGGRGTDSGATQGVPYFRSATTNTPTSFDVFPSGYVSGSSGAWIDVCGNDLQPLNSVEYQCAIMSARGRVWSYSNGSLVSIVVSGGVATVTTAAPHGLSSGSYTFQINGSSFSPGTAMAAITVTSATTWTFSSGKPSGTYTTGMTIYEAGTINIGSHYASGSYGSNLYLGGTITTLQDRVENGTPVAYAAFTDAAFAFKSSGVDWARGSSLKFRVGSNAGIGFQSSTDAASGTTDTMLSRLGAASIGVGNGTVGDSSGSITAATFIGALTGNASTATALASTVASGRLWIGQGTGVPTSDSVICADATNHRLGVGTCSPSYSYDSGAGDTTSQMRVGRALLGAWAGVDGTYMFLQNANLAISSNNYALAQSQTGETLLNTPIGGFIDWRQNNASRMRIAATTGNLLIGGTSDGNYKLDVANSGSTGTLRVYDQTATTGNTKEVIRAGAGQSTNLTEWQNNAGTVIANITSAGSVVTGGDVSGNNWLGVGNIRAGATQSIYWSGRTIMLSPADGQLALTNTAVTDFSRVCFGNCTSSFPALKRSTTILQARLADDSAMTDMQVSSIITKQTTPAASTDACTAGALWADASYVYACTSSGVIKRATLASF